MVGSVFIGSQTMARPVRDTTPPVITIIEPADGSVVSGTVTISFTEEDSSPVNKHEIYVNGVLRSSSSTYDWDTTAEADGQYEILCRAQDVAQNWGEETIYVTVENTVSPPPSTGAFKVLSYNIEESGANENWKEVIKEENPDIMILIETGTWDDNNNYKLNQVVNEFNTYFVNEIPYEGYCAQGITYSTSGAAILSRFPIVEFNQIPLVTLDDGSSYDVTHDFIHAVVDVDGTYVNVIGAHLKAMSGADNEWRRERETEGIINYMDSLGNVPIMYMGDLNSFSPDDTGDLAPLGDLGYGPMTMMLYPDDPVYGTYSSAIHTFTDVFRTLNPTDPGYTYGHQNPDYTSRIDFIVVNSYFADKLINSTTGDTPSADVGSDHYCVDVFVAWDFSGETDTDPPAKVSGLTVQNTTMSTVDLAWTSNSEPDLSHYRVYRDGSLIAQVYGTTYHDVGLTPSTSYTYEVSAVDTSINEGPRSDPAVVTTEEGGDPDLVVINEFLPDPYTAYGEEWIELYNPQSLDADISMYIIDDITGGGTTPYQIPVGTIIPGHGFLVFYQSDTGVGLNNDGDTVNFLQPDGSIVLDSYTYTSSSDDISYGREYDGGPNWVTFDSPTPGATNGGTPPTGDGVVLNEFLPSPSTLYTEEWIELYNPQSGDVDLSGYILDDITDGGTAPYTIPAGTIIPAQGFLLFYQSTTNIALNNAGDTVNLINPDGVTVIDTYTYSSSSYDVSYGREYDGGPTWITFDSPTPGTTNGGTAPSADAVVLNEFLPDPNTLYTEEWIELYNPLGVELDLSGYVLDDLIGGGTSPYTIPGGTIIPAYGFVVFYQSTTNIALNNDGDTVNFLKPDGTTVIDSYTYSTSSDDISYGRETDGSSNWITFDSPTPGASNDGSPPPTGDAVVLNEFLPDPNTLYTEEWIELYNPQSSDVDISGYILDDIIDGGTAPYTIPAGTIIPAYGFIVFYQSETGIALNNAGDTVNFINPDGTTVIDSYTYGSSSDDVSYGRETDGGATWVTFNSPTPGASNNGVALLINLGYTIHGSGAPAIVAQDQFMVVTSLVLDTPTPE